MDKEKCFRYTLHKCETCGYQTRDDSNASKHKKSMICISPVMIKLQKTAMDIEDEQQEKSYSSIDKDKILHITLHKCSGCNYTTCIMSNAKAHVKNVVKCKGCVVVSTNEQVILTKDTSENQRIDISEIQNENTLLKSKIKTLETNLAIKKKRFILYENEQRESDDDTEPEIDLFGSHKGLIYYIFDKVYTERAKIGRTQNLNVEHLVRRYSAVYDPVVWFFYSDDIRRDEKLLKDALKSAGHMWEGRGQEKINNTDEAKRIFSSMATRTFIAP
jgi:hypothetical protein